MFFVGWRKELMFFSWKLMFFLIEVPNIQFLNLVFGLFGATRRLASVFDL